MSYINVEQSDKLLLIGINRPEKKNALTGDMYETMSNALIEAERNSQIHVVVFRGSSGCFTAGNDIGDFLKLAPRQMDETSLPPLTFIRGLAQFKKPMVAAVDGLAIGIGTTMLLHMDLVYASTRSQFRLPFVELGLVPEGGASYLLAKRIGQARANAMILLGEALNGQEALTNGLINGVVDPEALDEFTLEKARKLANCPPSAVMKTRALLRGDQKHLQEALENEAREFLLQLNSSEAKAAFIAFLTHKNTHHGQAAKSRN